MRYKDVDNTSQEFGKVHMRQGSPDLLIPTTGLLLMSDKGAFVINKVYVKN